MTHKLNTRPSLMGRWTGVAFLTISLMSACAAPPVAQRVEPARETTSVGRPMYFVVQQDATGILRSTIRGFKETDGVIDPQVIRESNGWHLPPEWRAYRMNLRLEGKQTVELPDGAAWIYYFVATPRLPKGYDCHACHPVIAAMMTRYDVLTDEERVLAPLQGLTTMGYFGNYSMVQFGFPTVSAVGPGKVGLFFPNGDHGQGDQVSFVEVASIESSGFRYLGALPTGENMDGTGRCGRNSDTPSKPCANWRAAIQIDSGTPGPYYAVRISESGKRMNDQYEPAVTTASYLVRFNGTQYERVDGKKLF